MATLRLYLPESWSDGGTPEPLEWALCGAAGAAVASGRAPLAELPRAERLELVVPAAAVLLTSVVLPARGEKARRLLPFAVEERLAVEPESVHAAIGPAAPDGATPVAVVDKAWLERALALVAAAGLRPRRMVPETLLPECDDAAWTLVWNGSGGFVRSGACAGLAVDGGTAGVPLALTAALQEAGAAGRLPQRVAVRVTPGSAAPDCMQWTTALGLPVSRGPDWDWRCADSAAAPLDLLQGAYAPRGFALENLSRFKPALAILGLIVLLQGAATLADGWRLKREQRQLAARMEASFRQAFPEATAVVDPVLQMQRQLAALTRAAGRPEAGDFLPLLAQVAPLLEAAGDARLVGIGFDRGVLRLDLMLAGNDAAEGLRRRLAGAAVKAQVAPAAATAQGVPARVTVQAE